VKIFEGWLPTVVGARCGDYGCNLEANNELISVSVPNEDSGPMDLDLKLPLVYRNNVRMSKDWILF
jgi:hypothetical protein